MKPELYCRKEDIEIVYMYIDFQFSIFRKEAKTAL